MLLAAGNAQTEDTLLHVLLALVVIILTARLFAYLCRFVRQPAVVGEIAAGLALGPSLLGKVAPALSHSLFGHDDAMSAIAVLAHLGLIFLLFLVGLEFDFGHLRWHGRSAIVIGMVGLAVPFGLGAALAQALRLELAQSAEPIGFTLFMGTATAITAIPVLARIMMELNITATRLGTVTMAAAAIEDACGWIILAAIASFVQAKFDPWQTVLTSLLTGAFFLVMLFLVRPVLRCWVRYVMRHDKDLGPSSFAILIVIVFLCAIATNIIGIFAIFGAFLLGCVLSDEAEFKTAIMGQMRNFIGSLFLPIFFTFTGLRTDVGTLTSAMAWLLAGLVCLTGVAGKLGGCMLAARVSGFKTRDAVCVGALMNTRGLMELIVINVGRELGIIPESIYCMLVLMALVTTLMTVPLIYAFLPGTELEPHVLRRGKPRSVETQMAQISAKKDAPD